MWGERVIRLLFPKQEAHIGVMVFVLTLLSIFAAQRLQIVSAELTDATNSFIEDFRNSHAYIAKHDLVLLYQGLCSPPLAPFLQGSDTSARICDGNEPRRDIVAQARLYLDALRNQQVQNSGGGPSFSEYCTLSRERFGDIDQINNQGEHFKYIESPNLSRQIIRWSRAVSFLQILVAFYALLLVPPVKKWLYHLVHLP